MILFFYLYLKKTFTMKIVLTEQNALLQFYNSIFTKILT